MLDLGALSVKILADSSQAVQTLTGFQSTVDGTSSSISRTIAELGDTLTSIGTNMTTKVTLPIAAVGAAVTKVGADFEAQMSSVQAISGATGSELEQLEAKARSIGSTTSLSATQAAEGLEYMSLAGWKTTEMLEGYDGIVNLALSSNMQLGRATDIVTDYLTAFGLSANDAGHFADVMAYSMSNGNTTTEQLGEAYKNCASTSRQFGLSMEETTAWLVKAADAGLKGGEAGTTFNAVMARMYGETKTTNDAMMKYGLTMYDGEGKTKGFTQVMSELEEAMKGMTEQQQNVFLKAVAGTNQLSGFATMLAAGTDNVFDFTDALKDCDGTATDMALIMQDNLSGSIKLLGSNLEETAIQLYEMKDGAIKSFVDTINDMVTAFQELDDKTKSAIVTLAAVVAAMGPLTLVIGTTIKGLGALGASYSLLLAHPIVASVTALAAALSYVGIKALEAKAKQAEYNQVLNEALLLANDFTSSTSKETQALKDKTTALGQEIAYVESYSNAIEENNTKMQEIIDTMSDLDASREEDIERIQELQSEYRVLEAKNRDLIIAIGENDAAITEHIKILEDEYGTIESAKEVYESYNARLDNIANAQEVVNQCTNASSKSFAEEALQLATNATQAQVLVTKYAALSDAESNNKNESNELKTVREALIGIVGSECQYIDQSTGKWVINTDAVYEQIVANDNLSEAKRQACVAMNENDVELLNTCIENSRARITAWENELKAYAQVQMAELETNTTALKIYKNSGLLTQAQLEAKKRAESTMEAIELEKTKIEEYTKGIQALKNSVDDTSGAYGNFTGSASGAGDAAKKSGSDSKAAAKDALQAWQEMYTQKKKLGETDLASQITMLDEMKNKYSDSAEHIISANEFAQTEILNIVKQAKEEKSITIDEEIALYEMAKDKYCANAEDRRSFESQTNDAIKENVKTLVDDLGEMDLERIEDLKDSLYDMKDKYKVYTDDVSFIEDTLTEVIKEEYQKRKEELDSTLEDMKKAIDNFYGKQEDDLDTESKAKQEKLQEEINAIEAHQTEKDRIEREAKLLKAIADAEDEEARKEAQTKYDDWLLEQKKKALKAQLQEEKNDLSNKKALIEEQKADLKELLDYQYLLEAEKLEVKKNNQSLTDEEVGRIAKENLEKRMQEEVDAMSNNLQELLNNADEYENLGQMQMEYYLDGLKSYEGAIRSYFDSLIPGDIDIQGQGINGSHRDGLDFVPYDGYIAELHYGEQVLKKEDATENRRKEQHKEPTTNTIFDTTALESKVDKLTRAVNSIPSKMQINANMG